ncbi:non-ribosomal peptide synthetase, partial [Agrobacterium cavarae]|uniref:non-ribosomal peptide synthetase n=1 Tax=Agrobacterium cavarae TaxID=2528239 RepID=UPI003EE6E63D
MIYRAALQGAPAQLPKLPVQYADWTLWERETLQGERLQKQLDYWTRHLAGELPLLDLPFDRPRGATASFRGAHHHFTFDPTLSMRLRELARRQGVSLFTLLLTAYKVLLQRYTGTNDILVGIDIANRDRAETQGMIGPLVNTLVVRSDLSGDPSFVTLLEQVTERVRSGMAHQDVPFERVVEAVKPERRLGEMAPLFQAKFDLQHVALEPVAPDGIVLERYAVEEKTAKFELRFNMEDVGADISGKVEYATDLFDETTIERLARHYQVLLEAIASDPRQWISALRLMTEVEEEALLAKGQQAVLGDFNETAASYSSDALIHELFEVQAQRMPDAVAVVYEDVSLSYGELNAQANRLAHHLRGLGVRPDDRVAICIDRSLDMVVALLAVLKAGGAYVPLDPAYPSERLAFMLADSTPVAILSHAQSRQALDVALAAATADGNVPSAAPVIDLEGDAALWANQPATSPDRAGLTPASLAYIIYTSGSTGQPKGVMVEHRNVQRLMATTENLYEFGPDDVWTMFHSFAFDFSVWEIWGALLYGGRLVVVPHSVTRSPDAFYALLGSEGVTILNQTPSAFRQLIAVQPASGEQHWLRHVIFGGEALQPASLTSWYADARNSQTRLTNMYGITETTVHVTYRPLEMADTERGNVSPIGKPIADLSAYILDAHGAPVPIGVTGELYIGGAGVA